MWWITFDHPPDEQASLSKQIADTEAEKKMNYIISEKIVSKPDFIHIKYEGARHVSKAGPERNKLERGDEDAKIMPGFFY
jgi:hypothetical protein